MVNFAAASASAVAASLSSSGSRAGALAAQQPIDGIDSAVRLTSWVEYFAQDFYHASIPPVLMLTAALAYFARPSTKGERIPEGFRSFQGRYLMVWTVCVAADWLQGPFVYALYSAYGFSGRQIAELFVVGFAASLVFGCLVGTFADKFGRKLCCTVYCILYIVSCLTKHFNNYSILMFGRVTGGIATSMLFSAFECWMVSEHVLRHRFSGELLGFMFGLMFTVMYIVAIASGFIGEAAVGAVELHPIAPGSMVYIGGYSAAFDVAIVCLLVGLLMLTSWEENYGQEAPQSAEGSSSSSSSSSSSERRSPSMMDNIGDSVRLMWSDRRIFLLGVAVASFEGSMYAFVFNWTPALDSAVVKPPHGVIFALFMMACMCGASLATLLGDFMPPTTRLAATFAAGFCAFVVSAFAASHSSEEYLGLSFASFLLFEFCCGVYFPTVGVLKSDIVPEQVRGTMYNLYRVPLNLIVVILLLSDVSLQTCFELNALMLICALGSILAIHSMSPSPVPPAAAKLLRKSGEVGVDTL